MIVTTHAVRRLKFHGLAPKHAKGEKVKEYIKKNIKDRTITVYKDYETGALKYVTPKFVAVVYGERVITVYPLESDNDGQLREAGL